MYGPQGVLHRAADYALACVQPVTSETLPRPTPCTRWTLQELLAHMNDSLAALHEAIDSGLLDPHCPAEAGRPITELVPTFRHRLRLLGAAVTRPPRHATVDMIGSVVTTGIVAATGALEVAVHGWDVAVSCGQPLEMPGTLAEELLELAQVLVSTADRNVRFGPPVDVSRSANATDRLVAFLGRTAVGI